MTLTKKEIIGKQIRLRRLARDISAASLGRSIGRSAITIHNYEQGKYAPGVELLDALSAALGCGETDLLSNMVVLNLGEIK